MKENKDVEALLRVMGEIPCKHQLVMIDRHAVLCETCNEQWLHYENVPSNHGNQTLDLNSALGRERIRGWMREKLLIRDFEQYIRDILTKTGQIKDKNATFWWLLDSETFHLEVIAFLKSINYTPYTSLLEVDDETD